MCPLNGTLATCRHKIMNIAVFLPNWVGDVVMATPALRALRQTHAQARIIGVCKPYVAGVLDGAPWFDGLEFLDRCGPRQNRWPGVAWRLRRMRFDLAVLLANTFRSALVAWLAGCRRRVGFVRHGRGVLLTDRFQFAIGPAGALRPSPIIDDYNRLAQAVGCPRPGYRMELCTTAADEQKADAVWEKFRLGDRPEVICLNPGAAFGASKLWPAESFAQLAQDLAVRRDCKVLVLCGPAERDLARAIVARADRPGITSLADEALSLGLTKAVVRRSSLLVTTDSGPRHFAAAYDRPVITLFGPTHIAWTETYFQRAIHLQKPVPCGPCQKRVCVTDHACMRLLTPAEVLAAADTLLSLPPVQRKAS
jgi:heptosyltransferase II